MDGFFRILKKTVSELICTAAALCKAGSWRLKASQKVLQGSMASLF
jgi:hypothetical protein